MEKETGSNPLSDHGSKSVDVLGVKAYGDALKIVVDGSVKGAAAFFGRICLPAAEEFGLLLQDRVGQWRAMQAARIAEKADVKLKRYPRGKVHAHPRLVFDVIEKGVWSDDDVVQEIWAGILASSCTADGKDDSNIVFTSLLSQLTGVQVRILNYSIEKVPKFVSKSGLPYAQPIRLPAETLIKITGCSDIQRLDRELDHLRALDLIGQIWGSGGFGRDGLETSISPSSLALHLYVRGQGFIGSPVEFFDLKIEKEKPKDEANKSTASIQNNRDGNLK